MRMRTRYLVFVLFALAFGGIVGKRLLYPNRSLHAATLSSTPSQSYLVILGVGDTAPTTWDGSITATGATILSLQGWRFSDTDAITGTTGWTMSTREAPPPPMATDGPLQEYGVIVTIAAPSGPVTFTVKTPQGTFSFLSTNLPFGVTKSFLSGSARVLQTGAGLQLTSDDEEEEDFPSMAQSGDDVYLAYTEFVHGNRSEAVGLTTKTTITNFAPYARTAGGDQVLFLHYSKSQQVWTGPFPVTSTGQDLMRVAVAIDGQGRAWIFYSAQRNGNFDIYAADRGCIVRTRAPLLNVYRGTWKARCPNNAGQRRLYYRRTRGCAYNT